MTIRIQKPQALPSLPKLTSHFSSQPSPSPSPSPEVEPGSETRVSTAVSILLNHRSKSRWARLRSAFPTPLSPPESASILLRIRNNPSLSLRFFNFTSSCGSHHHPILHSAIIHVLARNRLRPETRSQILSAISQIPDNDQLTLFRTLSQTYTPFGSAPFVFDFLVQAYLRSDRLDLAVKIISILRSNKIQPSVSTLNSLLNSQAKIRGADAGFALYTSTFDPVRPNVRTFNCLFLAFHRENRPEMAVTIRAEMEKYNISPNVFTYSVLMAGLCEEGLVDEAERVWEGMEVKPDLVAYNTMVKGYCEAGEIGKAEGLFREMGLSGVEASCSTFECLARGHCLVGEVDSAMGVLRDARRRGFGIDVDEIIEGLCVKGRVVEGLEVLREETGRDGFVGSRKSYEALVRGFCRDGEMEEAVRMQAEMAGRGFGTSKDVYQDFAEGYRRVGDEEKAGKLEEEMVAMEFGGDRVKDET